VPVRDEPDATLRPMSGRWRVAASNGGSLAIRLVACVALAAWLWVASTGVRADDHVIVIHDTGFDPPTLTVKVGEPVTWTNESSQSVAVITADGVLDSGDLAPGEGFGHVFDAPGTIDYYVGGNPRIRATVVVEGAAAAEGTSPLVMVGVVVLAVVAVGAAMVTLIGAAGRQRRSAPPP
jgi:plastocyanin